MNCRHCNTEIQDVFLDLGNAPPSNAYLTAEDLDKPEITYPLKITVCSNCWLVQTKDFAKAHELFSADYAYFSSVSLSWLAHAKNYTDMIINKLQLTRDSLAVEVAANDGYLLKNFIEADIPCIGIEPTASTASAAQEKGVPIIQKFFSKELADEMKKNGHQADLIIGNNVYAHVPDINDFTAGLKVLLKENGVITLEFPHLLNLIRETQFDTVYHEHFSYFSLLTVTRILKKVGLRVYDVEELDTHGGSLRIYICHEEDSRQEIKSVNRILEKEKSMGMDELDIYLKYQDRVDKIKDNFLLFLIDCKKKGLRVAAYGAAAKGNTLINYSGVKHDLISCVYDAAPSKQNKYLPGSHIPILSPDYIRHHKPDVLIILPWNIREEILHKLTGIVAWDCQFLTVIPTLESINHDY